MKIERALQITIALMASTGTLLLGMGSDNVVLPVVAIFVAISSLYLTDLLGWVRLNRNVASLAAVMAVCISVIDFFQLERDRQLLAIAYLLIYLQIVLMYQQKDARVYWQLLMLSLLQVVVASALNFGLVFGILLIIYMFIGLLALSLFFICREIYRVENASQQRTTTTGVRSKNAIVGVHPLPDLNDSALSRGLWRRIMRQGVGTLCCTFVVFFLLPRFNDEAAIRRITARRMVGFAETVTLGALGSAFENPQSVMRVWFLDPKNGQPYPVHGEPLFRGTIVNNYEGGSWSLRLARVSERLKPLRRVGARLAPHVYQRISLEPLNESTIFSIYPAYAVGTDGRLAFNVEKQQIVRLDSTNSKMEFTLGTTGLKHGLQMEITPVNSKLERIDRRGLQQLLQLPDNGTPEGPIPRLERLARTVLENSGLSPDYQIARAKALERFLRDSGRFEYSLAAPVRDLSLDPIEDFIVNNARGHCEYFSSALTLMLRSQGIPARMVIGFKGGEWNSLGGYYQVRQLHAHSWVEVYLEDYPKPKLPSGRQLNVPRAGWLRLDPTPGSDSLASTAAGLTIREHMREWMDYGEFLWSNYVVDLNAKRQQEGIYAPLSGMGELMRLLFSGEFWLEKIPEFVVGLFQGDAWRWLKLNWLTWRGGMLAVFTLGALLVCGRLLPRLIGRLKKRVAVRSERAHGEGAATVEFYRRLETILKHHGMERPASQTPHEFAVAVGGQLIERPERAAAAGILRRIVDTYYRVRYGGRTLNDRESEQIRRALDSLQDTLKDGT